MGNRALITSNAREIEVYLHWYGGWDSVQCFLEYCRLKGYRAPDDDYGWARLCQVIANFNVTLPGESEYLPDGYDDGLCVGISPFGGWDVDFCDNMRYIIDGWRIVEWLDGEDRPVPAKDAQLNHDPLDMLLCIDRHQPFPLGEQFIRENMADWLIQQGDYDALARWLDGGAEEVSA